MVQKVAGSCPTLLRPEVARTKLLTSRNRFLNYQGKQRWQEKRVIGPYLPFAMSETWLTICSQFHINFTVVLDPHFYSCGRNCKIFPLILQKKMPVSWENSLLMLPSLVLYFCTDLWGSILRIFICMCTITPLSQLPKWQSGEALWSEWRNNLSWELSLAARLLAS